MKRRRRRRRAIGGYRDYLKLELLSSEIALASIEAEKSILYRERNPYNGLTTGWQELTDDEYKFIKDNAGENAEFRTVYTAPPAPVSVPERSMFEKWWESEHGSPLDSWDSLRTPDGYCDDGIDGQFEAWNACRAAMLNEGKSNG